eukprot:5163821-Pyramimonas_sp.AAC.1
MLEWLPLALRGVQVPAVSEGRATTLAGMKSRKPNSSNRAGSELKSAASKKGLFQSRSATATSNRREAFRSAHLSTSK